MCLRFQFCTHQRVCMLYFLKKSNSLYRWLQDWFCGIYVSLGTRSFFSSSFYLVMRIISTYFSICFAESIEWVTDDQAFLRLYNRLLASPLPSSSCRSFSVVLCFEVRAYWCKVGRGRWTKNNLGPPRKSMALCKSFNTLWAYVFCKNIRRLH